MPDIRQRSKKTGCKVRLKVHPSCRTVCGLVTVLALLGCVPTQSTDADGVLRSLPEALLDIAAPYQNLEKVRLDPADNCFWYLHDGPVEQTWIPLRTSAGNPICQAVRGSEAS